MRLVLSACEWICTCAHVQCAYVLLYVYGVCVCCAIKDLHQVVLGSQV